MSNESAALVIPMGERDVSVDSKRQPVLCSCASISGRREVNQDVVMAAVLQVQQNRSIVAATLADGLGGHHHGEVAAAEATKGFFAALMSLLLFRDPWCGGWSLPKAIRRTMHFCNQWIMSYAKSYGDDVEMGTTLVTSVIDGGTLYIGNVGDSRAYRWRRGILEQLTRDDSSVQCLVDQGVISPEQAETHPWSNVITRAIGWPDALNQFAVASYPIEPGDVVLLCSDGLWKGSNGLIRSCLRSLNTCLSTQDKLDQTVQDLVWAAFDNGSDDNISAVALWVAPEAHPVEDPTLPYNNPIDAPAPLKIAAATSTDLAHVDSDLALQKCVSAASDPSIHEEL